MGYWDDLTNAAGDLPAGLGQVLQNYNQQRAQAYNAASQLGQQGLQPVPLPTDLKSAALFLPKSALHNAQFVGGTLGEIASPLTGAFNVARNAVASYGPGLGNAFDVASVADPMTAPEALGAHTGQLADAAMGVFGSLAPKLEAFAKDESGALKLPKSGKLGALDAPAPEAGAANFSKATPDQFVAARAEAQKRAGFLSASTAADLAGHDLYLGHNGTVGYALDPQGDLQNVFNAGGPKGAGREALVHAIGNGAATLDAFDGYLPKLYSEYGFVPTGRMKFDPQYAPENWNFERDKQPDVVFMKYAGGDRGSIADRAGSFPLYNGGGEYFTDFDTAKALSRAEDVAGGNVQRGEGRTAGDDLSSRGGASDERVAAPQAGSGLRPVAGGLPLGGTAPLGSLAATPPQLFDLSRLNELPSTTQADLPRFAPPRGASARVTDLTNNDDVRAKVMEYIAKGQTMGGENWYNTDPLREAFIGELGPDAGAAAHQRYMDYVAATSPRSKVPENVRNASYYYTLERQGLPMPDVGTPNPQPYGHLAQRLHQQNAATVTGAGWDPLQNPKPASFAQNLSGNYEPVTVDTHALRLPAMLSRDPRWLVTGYKASKDAAPVNIRKLVESGAMSMDDAFKNPAYWESVPRDNEYGALEQYYKGIANDMGIKPAQAQASGWVGGGGVTGLGSDESKPFMQFFMDRVNHTANVRGEEPSAVLKSFIQGKKPLLQLPLWGMLGGGAALGAAGLTQQPGTAPPPT